ncbi:pentapeptide repeat-containing protein [Herbidospora mongoliensis]|uniref:pentapeptide repeat-containing protein n=1 Tax=Herbidospora mongoliensis TaxID=688067 RepID=UPI000A02F703|nr:pentapeptide repeat-containing protein [Herbidospora mongoliensis]
MATPRHPRVTRRYRHLPQRPPAPAHVPIPPPAAAARPRAASWLGRLLRRHPPVNRPTPAELADLSIKERQELWDAHRQRPFQAISSLITSVAVILGILFTARTLDYTAGTLDYTARALGTTQEGQITDRYTKAAEQLANQAVDVRLAAIYALQRLANDSPRDRPTIKNVLAAFVRNHDLCTPTPAPPQCARSRKTSSIGFIRLPTDVYTALIIAPTLTNQPPATNDINTRTDRADFSRIRFPYVDLSDAALRGANLRGADLFDAVLSSTDLVGADLRRANLFSANLSNANLSNTNLSNAELFVADLSGADLSSADLSGASLLNADLSGANLRNADLVGADLSGTNLVGADLTGADLSGAYLIGVQGMSPEEIRAVAKTDVNTTFKKI